MPPLMLSSEEALAVVLGLLNARAAPGVSHAAMLTATSKTRRVLPEETARRLGALLDTAAIDTVDDRTVPDADILLTVADAVARRYPLALRYRGTRGTGPARSVEPEDLVSYAGRWYLVAHDVDAAAGRTFRVDRIQEARRIPGELPPADRSDAARAVAELVDGFARAERRWRITLRAQADEATIRAGFPASVAVISALDGDEAGWHRVEIQAERLEWIPPVIAALPCAVHVDEPAELRRLLQHTAARLAAIARRSPV
ncbi:helix-turn-helix transcriptional regulator [Agromyces archimandritae]|uniref:WYL domain-containing protein n=1 Tax=Agromyces archimandritae TaxID=2781962 RepID=A0A975FLJ5_9MICO|nr:WYL domain-containing protein [Agromyces archimandritae]QTX04710.1 WYL domain-containing protein [Agromyces archimandritae]